MGSLKNHPGLWLRDDAAAALNRLEDDHGVFTVNSAGRTVAEQQALIDRWNRGGASNRPPYLFQPANPPETSNHVSNGGIAADIREYPRFASVCRPYGFVQSYPDGDPVHFDFVGGGSDSNLKAIQNYLIGLGYDLGPSGADGITGSYTTNAIKAHQRMLASKYGYTDVIDGVWGANTEAADSRFKTASSKPDSTDGIPNFPLPSGYFFGPEGGPSNSISGYHSYNSELRLWQQRMSDRGWDISVDGLYGPKGATKPTGNTATIAKAFQKEKGLTVDGLIGVETWKAAWTAPVTPPSSETEKPEEVEDDKLESEQSVTPNLKTPSASDFPSWISFDIVLDPDGQRDDINSWSKGYYGAEYNPIESHTHWWGEPGKSGSHDGNVNYIKNTGDLSTNFVVSANRVTLMVPLNKLAFTTGQRNPYGWKTENDPTLSDDGYLTLGYLHYIVEKLNPSLFNEPIRLHKEFTSTTCSGVDVARVRDIASRFVDGRLDPSTGVPKITTELPVVPEGSDTSDDILIPRQTIENLAVLLRASADTISEYLEE